MRVILTFHSIDNSGSVISFPVNAFQELMTSIAESAVPVVELDKLFNLPEGLTITFDDGFKSILNSAVPVLSELGFPSHLFLATGSVGGDNQWPGQSAISPRMPMLDWDELNQCASAGMRIESHTHMHPDLRWLDEQEIEEECEKADRDILQHTGTVSRNFAYPYGYYDRHVTKVIRKRYAFAVTTKMAFMNASTPDPVKLPRIDSYYLQHPLLYKAPFGHTSRIYLGLRRLLRTLRERLE